ncbi:hypothetical protein [Beijerinckia sp. L45]|uniref:hypothetical protein n=1 Tax=Beijerinckia sp. L45 TaxID=1641855 RepID=UPI00131E26CB|nr:hypothetical protein [Beijerinckia sp. L45]
MSYLIIPSAGGTCHRRVDFGAIAELFVEDEPASAPPPGTLVRATTALRAVLAPFTLTLELLRAEALAREAQGHRPEPRIARAFGI